MTTLDQSVLQQLQVYVDTQIDNKIASIRNDVQNLQTNDIVYGQSIPQIKNAVDAMGAKMNDLGTTVGVESQKVQEITNKLAVFESRLEEVVNTLIKNLDDEFKSLNDKQKELQDLVGQMDQAMIQNIQGIIQGLQQGDMPKLLASYSEVQTQVNQLETHLKSAFDQRDASDAVSDVHIATLQPKTFFFIFRR